MIRPLRHVLTLLLILLFVYACARGSSTAVCGDGICTPPETEQDCPEDCAGGALCGNGVVEGAEHCDGTNLDGMTCAALNAGEGTLACTSSCRFDFSGCSGGCVNQCNMQVLSRCNGNLIEQCRLGTNGCYQWEQTGNCSTSGKVCDDSTDNTRCVDSCTDACASGTSRCLGNIVQHCQLGQNGCLQWQDATDCSTLGKSCDPEATPPTCVDPCTDACDTIGAGLCIGETRHICILGTLGCREWRTDVDCSTQGKNCTGGECVCPQVCTSGQTRCNGNWIQSCSANSHGCLEFSNQTNCESTSQICNESGGSAQCAAQCTNLCTLGQSQCSGDVVQNCQTLGTGCTGWVNGTNCASQGKICTNGACACDNECSSGDRACLLIIWAYKCVQNSQGCWVWGDERDCVAEDKACFLGYCI